MIEGIKTWVIGITTMTIIISAVEMILPANSIKKYCKFVMGLILMVVIINPIISMVKPAAAVNIQYDGYEREAMEVDSSDIQDYKESKIDRTLEVWKGNLERQFKKSLEQEYPHREFQVNVGVGYNKEEGVFTIDDVKVGVGNQGGIKKIKPITIGKSQEAAKMESGREDSLEIYETIEKIFQIDKKKVQVFMLEEN